MAFLEVALVVFPWCLPFTQSYGQPILAPATHEVVGLLAHKAHSLVTHFCLDSFLPLLHHTCSLSLNSRAFLEFGCTAVVSNCLIQYLCVCVVGGFLCWLRPEFLSAVISCHHCPPHWLGKLYLIVDTQ